MDAIRREMDRRMAQQYGVGALVEVLRARQAGELALQRSAFSDSFGVQNMGGTQWLSGGLCGDAWWWVWPPSMGRSIGR